MRWQSRALLLTGLLMGYSAFAQVAGSQQRNPSQMVQAQAHDFVLTKQFQKRFAHMKKRYKLTSEQQQRVKSILWKQQRDEETVSADRFMSGRDKREEVANLFDTSQQKIGAILTKPQKRKFDADEKRRAWMDGRLPNPNPGPPLNGGW